MRNFKDFTRAIAGIATALKGINTVVDDIPVPGGSTLPDWTLVSGDGTGADTLSTTAEDYDATDKTELMLYVFNNTEFIPPVYINLAALAPLSTGSIHCRFSGSTYAALIITKTDDTVSIATTAGTIDAYIYLR